MEPCLGYRTPSSTAGFSLEGQMGSSCPGGCLRDEVDCLGPTGATAWWSEPRWPPSTGFSRPPGAASGGPWEGPQVRGPQGVSPTKSFPKWKPPSSDHSDPLESRHLGEGSTFPGCWKVGVLMLVPPSNRLPPPSSRGAAGLQGRQRLGPSPAPPSWTEGPLSDLMPCRAVRCQRPGGRGGGTGLGVRGS